MFKTYSYSPRLEYWDIEYSRVFVESEGFLKITPKTWLCFLKSWLIVDYVVSCLPGGTIIGIKMWNETKGAEK